jgi:hypothetical protein
MTATVHSPNRALGCPSELNLFLILKRYRGALRKR